MKTLRVAKVIDVEMLPPYGLRLTFDDGLVREVNLADELWGPMFEPLRDPTFFARVTIDHGTVAWPNGLDLDPLVLHGDLKPADRGVAPGAG
jgi:hypothetical protein